MSLWGPILFTSPHSAQTPKSKLSFILNNVQRSKFQSLLKLMAVFFSITACKIKIKKQIIYFQYIIVQNMQHHSKKLKMYHSEKTLDHSKAKSHQGKLQIPLLHVWCKRVVDCNKFIFFETLSQSVFSGKYLTTLASLATPWGVHHNPVLTLKVLCN